MQATHGSVRACFQCGETMASGEFTKAQKAKGHKARCSSCVPGSQSATSFPPVAGNSPPPSEWLEVRGGTVEAPPTANNVDMVFFGSEARTPEAMPNIRVSVPAETETPPEYPGALIVAAPGAGKSHFLNTVARHFPGMGSALHIAEADDIVRDAGHAERGSQGWYKWHRVCMRDICIYMRDHPHDIVLSGYMFGADFERLLSGWEQFLGEGPITNSYGEPDTSIPKVPFGKVAVVLPPDAYNYMRQAIYRPSRPLNAQYAFECYGMLLAFADHFSRMGISRCHTFEAAMLHVGAPLPGAARGDSTSSHDVTPDNGL
jgi:hypothetical protein